MSIKRPCKKGRKRHRFDSDGYCAYCNKPRQPDFADKDGIYTTCDFGHIHIKEVD